jgi:hypothetical protein
MEPVITTLTRPTPRPAARPVPPASKTKILLVRQPVKSVRRSDEPSRAGLHLAIGVIVGLGSLAALWLMGGIGFRLGFADLMRIRELQIDPEGGLAAGALMLMGIPNVILQAGIEQPMWLMIGFALIAIPAASLGAIKPASPGGPRPKPAIVFISFAGAAFAMLNSLALIAWTVSPYRATLISGLPLSAADAQSWLTSLQIAAGLDVLSCISAALWVVVIMRLNIPVWLRGLGAAACFCALVAAAAAMAMSNVSASQLNAERSVCFLDDGSLQTRLVLGYSPHSLAALNVRDSRTLIELRDRPEVLEIIGKQSIVEFLQDRSHRE